MFENSGLRSNDKELRKVAVLGVILAPFMIAAALLMLAAFPFHYLPHSIFWPAAFGEILLSNLLYRRCLLIRSNRKMRELETELSEVKARLKSSN
jgi:hypothetical protein